MESKYIRNCPTCNTEILYAGYESHRVAKKANRSCRSCVAFARTEEHYQKIGSAVSKFRTGKSYEELYGEEEATRLKKQHSENLTGKKRPPFSQEWRDNLGKSHTESEVFQQVMQSEDYKKTRRNINIQRFYPGLSEEEWEVMQGPKRLYYLEVMGVTKSQPLELLEHYDKRGRSGIEGAYQLDHIYPISLGFINDIPAEEIGHINNLQMIPWLENARKSNKLDYEK